MEIVEPGHWFKLNNYSGISESTTLSKSQLVFMHRVGDNYPGNHGYPYDGTNCQEVLRALIHRCIYLNGQIPCRETENIIENLRYSLILFEERAARVHGLKLPPNLPKDIENTPTCRQCGHIVCNHKKF